MMVFFSIPFSRRIHPASRAQRRVQCAEGFVQGPDVGFHRQAAGDADAAAGRPTVRAEDCAFRPPSQHLAGRSMRDRSGRASPAGRRRFPAHCGSAAGRSSEHHAHLARRRSISSASVTISRPSTRISPAVISFSRDRQRTSVDLPEPDRPMTTSIRRASRPASRHGRRRHGPAAGRPDRAAAACADCGRGRDLPDIAAGDDGIGWPCGPGRWGLGHGRFFPMERTRPGAGAGAGLVRAG